jgi:hypothetical protein
MIDMTDAEKLARAVLLFHGTIEWTADIREDWLFLTGSEEATTKTLCDLARKVRAAAERGQ